METRTTTFRLTANDFAAIDKLKMLLGTAARRDCLPSRYTAKSAIMVAVQTLINSLEKETPKQ